MTMDWAGVQRVRLSVRVAEGLSELGKQVYSPHVGDKGYKFGAVCPSIYVSVL